jgi:hypothetical protein
VAASHWSLNHQDQFVSSCRRRIGEGVYASVLGKIITWGSRIRKPSKSPSWNLLLYALILSSSLMGRAPTSDRRHSSKTGVSGTSILNLPQMRGVSATSILAIQSLTPQTNFHFGELDFHLSGSAQFFAASE